METWLVRCTENLCSQVFSAHVNCSPSTPTSRAQSGEEAELDLNCTDVSSVPAQGFVSVVLSCTPPLSLNVKRRRMNVRLNKQQMPSSGGH